MIFLAKMRSLDHLKVLMILEFMHALRETDKGLTLKQVFKLILYLFRIFVLLLFVARHPKSKIEDYTMRL